MANMDAIIGTVLEVMRSVVNSVHPVGTNGTVKNLGGGKYLLVNTEGIYIQREACLSEVEQFITRIIGKRVVA
jgi:hypothetical protein